MVARSVRHVKKKVHAKDVIPEVFVSDPPAGKKKVKNIYYDPVTKEVVIEIED